MPLECGIHAVVELAEFQRVFADEQRTQLEKTRTHAGRVSRQIEGPERTDLAVADEAGVGFNTDDGAVEYSDRFTARPLVGGLVQREIDLMSEDARDSHGGRGLRNQGLRPHRRTSRASASGSCC